MNTSRMIAMSGALCFASTAAWAATEVNRWLEIPNEFVRLGTVVFEQYGDNRSSNTFNPGPTENISLSYDGFRSTVNGSINNQGPRYQTSLGGLTFPYIQLDQLRHILIVHPGTFATSNRAGTVSIVFTDSGTYRIQGAFARANDSRGAGDGVDVLVFKNFDSDNPVFSDHISSDHIVNPDNPFDGSGVSRFDLDLQAVEGDILRFAVFSGPLSADGTFDATALEFRLKRH